MTKREKRSRFKVFLFIFLALMLLSVLGINFLVNLVVNRLVQDNLVKSANNANNSLNFNLNVRAFPSPKISINQLKYQHQGKPAVFIATAYLHIAFSDLFKKQLHIYDINIDGASINLANFPKLEINKTNKAFQEKKSLSQTASEGSSLDIDLINLKNIDIIYSTSADDLPIHIKTIQIKQLSSSPIKVELSLSKDFLDQLAAKKPPSNCPLPPFVRALIKGRNLQLTINTTERQGSISADKLLVLLNASGLSFKEGSVPTTWQPILYRCFNDQ